MKKIRVIRYVTAICMCILAVLGIGGMDVFAASDTEMNIYAMYLENEDKGDSVLVESKGEYLLMDIGVASHAPAIIKQLNALNVTKVDIYFSHLHADHVGTGSGDMLAGLKAIDNAGIDIGTMYLPAAELAPLSSAYPGKYQRLENFMSTRGNIVYLNVGDTFQVGDVQGKVIGPVSIEKLNPEMYADKESDDAEDESDVKYTYYENNCSLVSILTCGSTKFFTAGDMLEDQAGYLLKKYGSALDCDIMKLSHHGTGSGNTEELLKAVSPKYSFGSNTGLTGVLASTQQWETKMAVKNASDQGVCYLVGSQKKTAIYQVKNNVIKMYQGSVIQSGKYLTGWQTFTGADGKYRKTDRYYFDSNGVPLTGVQYLDGHYFYLGDGGCMEYGNYSDAGKYQYWKSYGDKRRYFTFSDDKKFSYMTVGFREVDGTLYYFGEDGFKLEGNGKTERVKIGTKYYTVGASGAITRSNWASVGSDKYYSGQDGSIQTNYKVKIGKNYYLFGSDGKMLRASSGKKLVKLNGKTYCVGTSGALTISNWASVGKDKYYFGKDGVMQTNVKVKISKDYYYFGKDGKMVRASKGKKLVTINGKKHCVGTSGKIIVNDWATVGKDKYCFGKTGVMRTSVKVKINKKYYYFGKSGKMVRNTRVKIDKKYYYFGSSGEMYVKKYVTIKGVRYYCNSKGVMVKK